MKKLILILSLLIPSAFAFGQITNITAGSITLKQVQGVSIPNMLITNLGVASQTRRITSSHDEFHGPLQEGFYFTLDPYLSYPGSTAQFQYLAGGSIVLPASFAGTNLFRFTDNVWIHSQTGNGDSLFVDGDIHCLGTVYSATNILWQTNNTMLATNAINATYAYISTNTPDANPIPWLAGTNVWTGTNTFTAPIFATGGIPGYVKTNDNAIGTGATAASQGIAFGATATSANQGTALGYGALANGSDDTAVGRNTIAGSPGLSVAVGDTAHATGGQSVAVGFTATAAVNATAIGEASGAANQGTALGWLARANSTYSVAVGGNAQATSANAVELGNGTATAAGVWYIGEKVVTTNGASGHGFTWGNAGSNVFNGPMYFNSSQIYVNGSGGGTSNVPIGGMTFHFVNGFFTGATVP